MDQTLDPRVRTLWLIEAGLAVLVALVLVVGAAVVAVRTERLGLAPASALVAAAGLTLVPLAVVHAHLRFERFSWHLGPEALRIRSGVWWRTETATPYFRVQHVDLSQGPLERALSLTSLRLRTASSGTEAILPGVAVSEAERIRVVILERTGDGDAV